MSYIIKGKAHWAKVYDHNAMDDKYSIDVSLSDTDAKFCEGLGLKVKTTNAKGEVDDRGTHITCTAYMNDYDGNPAPIKVIDSKMQPMTELIGNGSEVNVEFYVKNRPAKSKVKGVYAYLLAVQVTDLVKYNPGLQAVDGGYVATTTDQPAESTQEDVPPFEIYSGDVSKEAV